jgi:H+/Cl- antiporter ClcA
MNTPSTAPTPAPSGAPAASRAAQLRPVLLGAALGIPVSLAAFVFSIAAAKLGTWLWETLPEHAGHDEIPRWWPFIVLPVAGLLVGLVVKSMPGHGGHLPADGMGVTPTEPSHVPGVVLAALVSLAAAAVVGPEGPLLAIGSGIGVLANRRMGTSQDPTTLLVVSIAAQTAAVAAIFGSPVVALVLVVEMVALTGVVPLSAALLPAMASGGTAALMFSGLGRIDGVSMGGLAVGDIAGAVRPDLADLLWCLPLAAVVAAVMAQIRPIGKRLAPRVTANVVPMSVAAGALIAGAAVLYSVLTDRTLYEVLSSGHELLGEVITEPASFATGALVALIALKAVAYILSMVAFRGGLIFPALLIGAAAGVVLGHLPGLGTLPGIAIGMTAATVVSCSLPITSVVLVALILGASFEGMAPLILVSAVIAMIVSRIVPTLAAPAPVEAVA